MRTPMVAGNWKMYQTIAETRQLIVEIVNGLNGISGVQIVICSPHTALLVASALLEGSNIELGAQNVHWDKVGAFTGEVSPIMIAEICNYVIIGHSERRTYFGETDTIVNKKVKSALENHLNTFVCVGETIEQREADRTRVISDQLKNGLNGVQLEQADSLIISYEQYGRLYRPGGCS
jgi:triosephosphate isomerase